MKDKHFSKPSRQHAASLGSRSEALLFAILVAISSLIYTSAHAQDKSWIATWMAAPQPTWEKEFVLPTGLPSSIEHKTVRQIVRVSLGGTRLRLRFSNAYGDRPLHIGGVTVAKPAEGASLLPDTLRRVTFNGKNSVSVPPGAPILSDPVELDIQDLSRLAVSLYLPNETPLTTFHWDGRQTSYLVDGDRTLDHQIDTGQETTTTRLFLTRVLIETPNRGAVVVLGDSITDGNGATIDADTRWPDFLGAELLDERIAVLNAGISGGRLLRSKMGDNALARFSRDVLSVPGIRVAIVLIGINDISWPGTAFAPGSELPELEPIIAGYRQLIERARIRDVTIIGATLLPFEGALEGTSLSNYYSSEKDRLRGQVNNWIRNSTAFDAVVDFDTALRDTGEPTRLKRVYDSGDHLHPNDRGHAKMADAIDPDFLFTGQTAQRNGGN